ncbi:SPOR domain-containing protein [Parasphingopyxis lamellibrachiae]|uniref:Tetratricopeptide repeat protein n=1 Tax=Parasphingopyxis lamellibrachiae TaxID=680125 RepID=A0A3D9FE45_9SPHN|nr:SPOR domain-containing protein [Parasphingopyxis lamellibrachiae]RED15832.1 tetratricopeptide repeat protein [Parasphingopyxis lamellibrachiae]
MKPSIIKIAASTLAVGASIVGFSPLANSAFSTGATETDSRASQQAASSASSARSALAENDSMAAIRHAELAVDRMPNSAEYRHLLGRAYLAAGRFASAETSFQDALTLNPDLNRTAFNLALTQIAQGQRADALAELNALEGRLGASDLGLAMALAGNHDRAIEILQQAARANGGDPRARQNLALTYAMAGRWAEARITAAQDISLADLDSRMRDWTQFSAPEHDWDQVASLLGVEAERNDPGQPVRLALVQQDSTVMMAEAPAAADQAVQNPVVAFTAPAVTEVEVPPVIAADPEPMRVAAVEAEDYSAPAVDAFVVEDEDNFEEADATDAIAVAAEPAARPVVALTAPVVAMASQAAPAEESWLAVLRAARRPDRPVVAAAPVAQPVAPAVQAPPAAPATNGRYVIQLGAFSSEANVRVAWNRAVRRYSRLSSYTPSHATFDRGRTLYRLSFGGFATSREAARMCRTLRSRGQECFVRTRAGDAPLQMAARAGAGMAALR